MDRTAACGAADVGSIPTESTLRLDDSLSVNTEHVTGGEVPRAVPRVLSRGCRGALFQIYQCPWFGMSISQGQLRDTTTLAYHPIQKKEQLVTTLEQVHKWQDNTAHLDWCIFHPLSQINQKRANARFN